MSAAQVIRFAFLLQGYPPAEFCKSIQVFPEFKQPSPFPLLFFFFSPLLFFNVEMTESFLSPLEKVEFCGSRLILKWKTLASKWWADGILETSSL